jgi:hypothetical protein
MESFPITNKKQAKSKKVSTKIIDLHNKITYTKLVNKINKINKINK